MLNLEQPIVIITGMHRSGTSLIAALLQSAGINLGQRLLAADAGNAKGYFENLDFLAFHQNLFAQLGINKVGWTLEENITIPEAYISLAKELIQKSASSTGPWGWKDPRTLLLLDFWANLLPQAKFVFIYRAPWEVLDSLYRRGDQTFVDQPQLALSMWMFYNKKLLNFYQTFPEQCLLVSLNRVIVNPEGIIDEIKQKWGIPLTSPDAEIYERSLLHRQTSKSHYPLIIQDYFPEVFDLYTQLNQITGETNFLIEEKPPKNAIGSQVLQDWLNKSFLERENKKLSRENEDLTVGKNWLEAQYNLWKQEAEKTQQAWEESQKWIEQLKDSIKQLEDSINFLKESLRQSQEWYNAQSQQWEQQNLQSHQAWQESIDWIQKLEKDIEWFNQQLETWQKTATDAHLELTKAYEQIQQLQQQKQNLEQFIKELQQEKTCLESEKADLEGQCRLWEQKMSEKQREVEEYQRIIEAMESSKFWQLRNTWFKLKQTVDPN